MAILNRRNITMAPTGLVDVNPSFIYIFTNNSLEEVTEPGFLNNSKFMGYTFSNSQMALVYITTGVVLLSVKVDTNGNVSLVDESKNGFIKTNGSSSDDHIVAYSGTTGELVKDSGINYNNLVLNNILNDITYTVTGQNPGETFPISSTVTSTNNDLLNAQLFPLRAEVNVNGMSSAQVAGARSKATLTGIASSLNTSFSAFSGEMVLTGSQIDQTTVALFLGSFVGDPSAVPNEENIYHVYTQNTSSLVPQAYDRRDGDANFFGSYAQDIPSPTFYLTAGTSSGSAGKNSNCNAPFVITLLIGGTTCYIPVFTQNT